MRDINPNEIAAIQHDRKYGIVLVRKDKLKTFIPGTADDAKNLAAQIGFEGEVELGVRYILPTTNIKVATLREQIIADIRATLPAGTYNVSMKQLAVFLGTTEKNTRRQIDIGALPLETIPVGARKYVTITALTNYMVGLILHENEPKLGQPVKALAQAKKMAENGKRLLQLKGI